MNTANLQLEGLMLAVAALFGEMKRNGSLNASQIEVALDQAENGASQRTTDLPEPNAQAIRFPVRFLREALRDGAGDLDYRNLVAAVGRARANSA